MSKLCIIPARGGSKRIPKKNRKEFLGKPIIAYSIQTAIESELFHEVMVSTDDKEIVKIAKNYGAKVPFLRSNENADDFATTFDVIEEVLKEYQKEKITFKSACCFYPCAPFVTPKRLIEAYNLLTTFDTVFPVVKFSFPVQRALKMEGDKKIAFLQPEHSLTRSQDLKDSFHDAGQFYWFKPETLLQSKTLMTDNTGAIELSELEVQDIDNPVDWKLAELKYKLQHELS